MNPACSHPGCGTILSSARVHDGTCWLHAAPRRPQVAQERSPDERRALTLAFFTALMANQDSLEDIASADDPAAHSFFPEWGSQGACHGTDPQVFDVDLPSDRAMTNPVRAAKAICARCPVRRRCLAWGFHVEEQRYALNDEEIVPPRRLLREMVYGGLTGRERMSIDHYADRLRIGARIFNAQRRTYRLDEEPPERTFEEEETA